MASRAFIRAGGKALGGVVADYFERADTPINEALVSSYRARYKMVPDRI